MDKKQLEYSREFFNVISDASRETLYHYCSGETLKAILDKKNLRAGHLKYMNDYTELERGRKTILKALKSFFREPRTEIIAKHEETAVAHFEAWDDLSISGSTDLTLSINDITYDAHAVSLSEDPDVLSQWRGYADGAKGYSVGFNVNTLLEKAKSPKCGYFLGLAKVIYQTDELTSLANEILKDWENKVAKIKNPMAAEESANFFLWNHLCFVFALLATMCKHEGFSEEREWRLLYARASDEYTGLETYVRDSTLIPFISFDLSTPLKNIDALGNQESESLISEIWCGPKQQHPSNERLIKGYAQSAGFNVQAVNSSKVTFR